MKVLILGAGGMLGHKLYQTLRQNHSCKAVFRKPAQHYLQFQIFNKNDMIGNIDVTEQKSLLQLLDKEQPDVICNAIGKTTRKINQQQNHQVVYLNSYLPQLLNSWCLQNSSYLVHFSTDCVFSGSSGPYKTNDFTDARDLYGLSKNLGEISNSSAALTLRTSIVGREIENKTEFFEWIFSNKNKKVQGYKNVFYSGVTTLFLSQVVSELICRPQKIHGLHQLASPTISKLDLIKAVNKKFNLNMTIVPNFEKVSNKVLIAKTFSLLTQIKSQTWDQMLTNLKNDNETYLNRPEQGEKSA